MTSEPLPLSTENLLAEARWLESLARALVADREEARDLVQEVWAKASEPGRERVERPRAWLATLLHNALRSRRRAASAREVRERSHARDSSVPGAGDVVARAEAQRSLVEHVLALDEPWRSTVLLRFYDGLSGEQIARRLGVPASTVRNRLAHALALLRARLERSRRDWLAGLVLLARGAPRSGVPVATILGGVLVSGGVKLGLGAAALALVWWGLAPREEGTAAPLASVESAAAADEPAPREPGTLAAEREPVVASVPVVTHPPAALPERAPATALPPGVLEVIVLDDGAPCPHAGTVELAPEWYPWMPGEEDAPETTSVRALAPGAPARFAGLGEGRHGLRAALAAHTTLSASLVLPADAGLQLVLDAGSASFHGTVWDEEGRPVEGATVVTNLRTGAAPTLQAHTASDGGYALPGLAAGPYFVWLRMPDVGETPGEERHSSAQLARGEARRLDFGTGEPLPHWRGALRTRAGAVHRGGAVLELRQGDLGLVTRAVDEQGRFDLRLEAGTYAVACRMNEYDSFAAALGEVALSDQDLELDLVLPGARIAGRVRHAASGANPVSAERSLMISVRLEGHDYGAAVRSTWVETDGHFALDALEPGLYLLNAYPLQVEGGSDSLRVELLPGQDELALDVFVRAP